MAKEKFETRKSKKDPNKLYYRAYVCVGGVKKSKWCESYDEAKGWKAATETKLRAGLLQDDSAAKVTTLRELLERFSDEVSADRRTNTSSKGEQARIKFLARFAIAGKSLASLSRADVRAYRAERLQSVVASTVSREIDILRSAVEWARDPDAGLGIWLPENVFMPLVKSRRTRNTKAVKVARERVLSLSEIEAQLTALASQANGLMKAIAYILAQETGLRRSELLAVHWGDVRGVTLRVERVADIDDDGEYIETPRTKNGKAGVIPLTPGALAALASLPRGKDNERIFPSLTVEGLKSAWRRACKTSSVVDFRWHDLRHHAISQAAELLSGDAFALRDFARHSDVVMTGAYTHVLAERTAQRMAAATIARAAEKAPAAAAA